jgi:hypothetical protein
MSNAEKAAAHAAEAEELLAGSKTWKVVQQQAKGALAGAHATLALFYQREAEREVTHGG